MRPSVGCWVVSLTLLALAGCLARGADPDAAPARQDSALPMLLSGMGLMQLPKLQAYLQAIADMEVAAAPEPGRISGARVYLVPTRNFVAESGPNGGIFLSLGTLEGLSSEDAVAFVIGHELAHVALGHLATRSGSQGWMHTLRILAVGSMRLAAHNNLQANSLKDLRQASMRDAIGVGGAGQLADSIMFPSWSRDQESEADQLGLTLAVRAGYSPSGADEVFDRLEQEDLQREREAERVRGAAAAKEAQTAPPSDLKGQINQVVKQSTGALQRAIDARLADAGNAHGAATARHDHIEAYIDKAFPDTSGSLRKADLRGALAEPETAVRTRAYAKLSQADDAFYTGNLARAVSYMRVIDSSPIAAESRPVALRARLVTAAGHTEQARQLLLPLVGQAFVTLDCYVQLIRLDLKAGMIPAAESHVQAAKAALGDPQELFPTELMVLKASGQQIAITITLARCYAVGDDALSAECRTASGT